MAFVAAVRFSDASVPLLVVLLAGVGVLMFGRLALMLVYARGDSRTSQR